VFAKYIVIWVWRLPARIDLIVQRVESHAVGRPLSQGVPGIDLDVP